MPLNAIRALIIDDEPIARQVLREELEQMPGVTIAGEAENGKQALDQVAALRPDLLFLDLQMPGMSGFEVVQGLGSGPLPAIIIVTAYDRYAIQAFEAGAVDYLLKPVGQQRLAQSIERVRAFLGNSRRLAENVLQLQEIAEPAGKARRIVGRLGEEYILLDTKEVLAFQAEGDLVWIITAKQRYQATQPLRVIQEKLGSANFQRIHRNALVNVDHVRKMAALSSQRWLITLSNQQEFIVSKRLAHNVRQILSW